MQVQHTLSSPESAPGAIMPQLLLSQGALDMIDALVHAAAPTEVSGFAYVQMSAPGMFYVAAASDVFVVDQLVTIGSADFGGTTYALALDRAVEEGRDSQLRLLWHSHPQDAYFSPTDLTNIENFGAAGGEWFINLVTNRAGDIHARFDRFRPERIGGEMAVQVYREIPPAFEEFAKGAVEEHLKVLSGRRLRKGVVVAKSGK